MTDEVGRLVLADNEDQNDLMGTSRANAASLLPVHARQIKDFVAERGLNRELEALPSEKEIRRRTEAGLGLTSPELATLMAHVKLALKDDVLASDLPDQEVFASRLPRYFPSRLRDQLRQRYPLAPAAPRDRHHHAGQRSGRHQRHHLRLPGHRRRRRRPGRRGARAYVATNAIFRIGEVWRQIRAAERVGRGVRSDDAGSAPARSTGPDAGCSTTVRSRWPSAPKSTDSPRRWPMLTPRMSEWLRGDDEAIVKKEAGEFASHGVSKDLAYMVATGLYQYSLLDVIDIADIVDRDPAEVADTYFALMDHLGTDRSAHRGVPAGPRRPLAFVGALGDSRRHLRVPACAVLRCACRWGAGRERRARRSRNGR